MLSHVCVGVNDFDRAFAFYSAVMAALGHELKFCEPTEHWAGWNAKNQPRPLFIVTRPYDGDAARAGNGQMIGLLASSRKAVDTAYDSALANGGKCEGAPALRPQYHSNYYGAYFRDPEGNKIAICCHDPE